MGAERQDSGGESPAAALLGRRVLGIDPESGDLRVEYRAGAEFSNRNGTLAGGFVAAMLDSLLALVAARGFAAPTRIATKKLHVSFERPCSSGPVVGRARVESTKEGSVSCTGELLDQDGQVLARGAAVQRILSSEDAR